MKFLMLLWKTVSAGEGVREKRGGLGAKSRREECVYVHVYLHASMHEYMYVHACMYVRISYHKEASPL